MSEAGPVLRDDFWERVDKAHDEARNTHCKYCGTLGDHYCPNDLCRPDEDEESAC